MKANELMIGDWVLHNTYPERIKLIGNTMVKVCNCDNTIDIDEICPIPLTGEILEKNGWIFQKYPDDEMFIWPLDNEIEMPFRLLIGMDGNRYWVTAGIGGLICPIDYVHELQHALRLCGIEKEIEL